MHLPTQYVGYYCEKCCPACTRSQRRESDHGGTESQRTPVLVCGRMNDDKSERLEQSKIARQANRIATIAAASAIAAILISAIVGWINFQQWRDLRGQFKADQRAWLKFEFMSPEDVTEAATGSLRRTNVGKSVALRTFLHSYLKVVDSDSPAPLRLAGPTETVSAALTFPTEHSESPLHILNADRSRRALTSDEIARLLSGRSYMLLYGQGRIHTDQFGLHWQRFCFWRHYSNVDTTAKAIPCVAGVDFGDGAPPKE